MLPIAKSPEISGFPWHTKLAYCLELLGERLRAALNAVAETEPDWLKTWVPLAWFER